MNNNDSLSYYQSRPKQAFMDKFVGDTSFQSINQEIYHGLKFYIPSNSRKRIKFIKKYFAYIDYEPNENDLKRRKNWCEFSDTSALMLQRVDSFFARNHVFIAGSEKVCTIPWAIFGKSSRWHQHIFECLVDVSRHYSNFLHGKCYPLELHFKNRPEVVFRLAKKYKTFPLNNPNFWMGVALNLTYDLIHNCAPDCAEVFELFTNDIRVGPGDVSDEAFEDLRFKILGIHPSPMRNLPKVHSVECVPKKVKTEIAIISDGIDDLSLGENFVKVQKPMLCLPPHDFYQDLMMMNPYLARRFNKGWKMLPDVL